MNFSVLFVEALGIYSNAGFDDHLLNSTKKDKDSQHLCE